MGKTLLSIVTPCYNEELNVDLHLTKVFKVIAPFRDKYDFEHIYTDNCSEDGTFSKLKELCQKYSNVKAIKFSRNVGANRAIYQGLISATGEAAILIQADLQDPPELIKDFIEGWEEGYDVVYGQIANRDESFIMKNLRRLYYWVVAKLADVRPPQNSGEFRLMSRRVLDALKNYKEDNIYLRGVIAHIGFKQKAVSYQRAARSRGESSTNIPFLIGYALHGLTSTTVVPIRFIIIFGFVTGSAGFLFGIYNLVYKLIFPSYVPHGITTLAILITFFTGAQLFALGVIGEYIQRIFLQSLNRPQAFVDEKVNFQ